LGHSSCHPTTGRHNQVREKETFKKKQFFDP
jgi:hypothetical protein